jgi:D-alanine-D-alanine ligase
MIQKKEIMQKLRVGVLMGGKSQEREVSFNSGRTVYDHLDTSLFDVIPLFQKYDGTIYHLSRRFLHRGSIKDFVNLLTDDQKILWDDLPTIIDFMYIATHGRFAEDGTLQSFLELLQIPYLGSKRYASALCMDKIIQKKILAQHNIATPPDIVITPHKLANIQKTIPNILKEKTFSFPLIVKPYKEGSSLGITFVKNITELYKAINHAAHINEIIQSVLIEPYITGMEFSCILLKNEKNNWFALPPTEIVPENDKQLFCYDQKYMPGRATKFTPPRCNKKNIIKIQQTAMATAQALEMETIARIDGFVTKNNEIIIIDPNSLSGMGPASFLFREAAEIDMNHTQVINHLIKTELNNYGIFMHNELKKDSQKEKISVGVFFGGNSHEREISLESGRNVMYKLFPEKYKPIALFVDEDMKLYHISQKLLVKNSTREIKNAITSDKKILWHQLPQLIDFAFIALHGGSGEDGTIQGTLAMLEIPYNGSSIFTSALCMDKYKTNTFLAAHNIHVAKNALIINKDWSNNDTTKIIEKIMQQLSLPLIAKPHNDGCSMMVKKIMTKKDLIQQCDLIFNDGKHAVLIEEFINAIELTVGVLGNEDPQVLPPSLVVRNKDVLSIEEKFLPGAGQNQTPAPLSKKTIYKIKQIIKTVYKLVNCSGYARIDCFYDKKTDRVIIIEINTLPGITPATCLFHQAAEVDIQPMEFVDKIITLGFAKHKPKVLSKFLSKDKHTYKLNIPNHKN